MPTSIKRHEFESSTHGRRKRVVERRKAIRGLMVSAVVFAATMALWWLVATTNSEGHHDAQLLPLLTLIPLLPALLHLYRSRSNR